MFLNFLIWILLPLSLFSLFGRKLILGRLAQSSRVYLTAFALVMGDLFLAAIAWYFATLNPSACVKCLNPPPTSNEEKIAVVILVLGPLLIYGIFLKTAGFKLSWKGLLANLTGLLLSNPVFVATLIIIFAMQCAQR